MNKKEFWENRSHEHEIKSEYNERLNDYVNLLYQRMTDLAYNYIKREGKQKILKTDLWDAIIEKERNMLKYLQEKFKWDKIYGVDISENLVNKVKIAYPDVICQQLDLTQWSKDFKDFSFIWDYSTLDHIQKENLEKVFSFYECALRKWWICLCIYYRRSPIVKISNFLFKIFKKKSFFEKNEEIWQYFFDDSFINQILDKRNFIIKKELNINIFSSFPFSMRKHFSKKTIYNHVNNEVLWNYKLFMNLFSSMKGIILQKK